MTPLSTGGNDTGQHGEGARTGGCAGAVADFTQNHPVTERALGRVVGER